MTYRGSGSGGPHPQLLVLITGLVALLGIPVGLTLAGWDPLAPTAGAGRVSNVALVPAAAPAPAAVDAPTVTVRELPARPSIAVRRDATPAPAPPLSVLSAPAHRLAAVSAAVTAKPRSKVHRIAKGAVAARRRAAQRRLAEMTPETSITPKRAVAVERRTYASTAAEPRPERTQVREREYASREIEAPREKPSRERPKRERSRRREASRPKETEPFGAGNSGFHYGASYDPYSMHVGR